MLNQKAQNHLINSVTASIEIRVNFEVKDVSIEVELCKLINQVSEDLGKPVCENMEEFYEEEFYSIYDKIEANLKAKGYITDEEGIVKDNGYRIVSEDFTTDQYFQEVTFNQVITYTKQKHEAARFETKKEAEVALEMINDTIGGQTFHYKIV